MMMQIEEERTCPELTAALLADADAGRWPQLSPKEARTAGYALKLVADDGWPTPYTPEVQERMAALVRRMAGQVADLAEFNEARAIVAMLPAKVDADLVEAREVVAKWRIGYGEAIRKGEAWQEMVEAVLMGIRRGREIEQENMPKPIPPMIDLRRPASEGGW